MCVMFMYVHTYYIKYIVYTFIHIVTQSMLYGLIIKLTTSMSHNTPVDHTYLQMQKNLKITSFDFGEFEPKKFFGGRN